MLKRFVQIRDEFIEVRNEPEVNLVIDASERLAPRVQRFHKILSELYVEIKSLQTRGHSLGKCRDDLEVFVQNCY